MSIIIIMVSLKCKMNRFLCLREEIIQEFGITAATITVKLISLQHQDGQKHDDEVDDPGPYPGILKGWGPTEFSSTTYSGAICIANKQNLLKKGGGGGGGGGGVRTPSTPPTPLDLPLHHDKCHTSLAGQLSWRMPAAWQASV